MKRNFLVAELAVLGLLLSATGGCLAPAPVNQSPRVQDAHDDATDTAALREVAAQRVQWRDPQMPRAQAPVAVKLLAINDFHGHISAGQQVGGKPAGGAAVFAAYLRAAAAGREDHTFIVHAGDAVGASPLSSALLHDEPTILFLNQFANSSCRYSARMNSHCNLVGTLGNHEFDHGPPEMLRLIQGGNAPGGSFAPPYRGAKFPYVSANVVSAATGKPILPPYVIKRVTYKDAGGHAHELPLAFIGAVLQGTPSITTPQAVKGVSFLDEAEAINRYVPEIRRQGVHAIVVLLHQGGRQRVYDGQTDPGKPAVTGEIVNIVSHLDDDIDVVVSGHTHAFTNALLNNAHGKPILVTQAFSYSTAYADIDLEIDPVTHDVVSKSASIVTTYADRGPGLTPDRAAAALVAKAEARVAPVANQLIAHITADITHSANSAGESALGDLITDAQRTAAGVQVAFMNSGGIRADLLYATVHNPSLPPGSVTYNDLFTIQPFGNELVKMDLTGQQLLDVLNQQFPPNQLAPRLLLQSGLTYTWDASAPAGNKIVAVQVGNSPLDKNAVYSVAVNTLLASGGDNFAVFNDGRNRVNGPTDIDALVDYLKHLPQPVAPPAVGGRIKRLH